MVGRVPASISCPSAERPITNWSLHPQRAKTGVASVDALRWPVPANCVAGCVEDKSPAASDCVDMLHCAPAASPGKLQAENTIAVPGSFPL
ncbi:hypothetical protein V8C42DRAFT_313827 [Trichoderma barbatum]